MFHDGVDRLAARGRELNETGGGGLAAWLEEFTRYTAVTRGLAVALLPSADDSGCHGMLADVATELAATAVRAGRLRPEITVDDLLALANVIAIRAEDDPEWACRLQRIALRGVEPQA
ncbi:hypothetical protein [Streptomyces sp. NPDC048663]|uniref:SbtR family transcriptional regulator n=1 Tax=Streptomyces sp. NPDC048663 TaxID=3155638 RepID=UPI0034211C5E